MQLNDAQQTAVDVTYGPALVVAGAGTGKTRVIVERIIRLIRSGVKPEHILALTFTEKAAGEMLDRVSEASLGAALETTIATYNGFGNDLLERYGSEWGLGSLRLLGDTGQLVFLREHFDELELDYFAPISSPDGQLKNLADYVSLLKQQLVSPEAYEHYAAALPVTDEADALEKKKQQELATFYKTYLELCRTNQVIDYDDQIYLTIQLLHARPNILRQLQAQYQYLLVDEFQDTNPMQSALIDLLADKEQNLMVVGDDDQSIYGWRGATLANILDFKKRYPKAKDITLIENYRSTQHILDAAYRLIQNNNPDRLEVINKLDKRLHAQTSDGLAPTARHFYTFEAELTWIAEDIAARIQNGQDPAHIAVLARRNQGIQRAHEVLELHGVPHAVVGLQNDMYKQPAVRQLIEVLRAIGDPLDNLALFHTLCGPAFGLSQDELSRLSAQANRAHELLGSTITQTGNDVFKAALEQLEQWRLHHADMNVGDLAYAVITESGWKQRLYEHAESDTDAVVQAQALSEFFKTLKEFERIATIASVQSYLANLAVLEASGNSFGDGTLDISEALVNVLSVHKAKGLEWDTVYVIDCTEGSFPMRNYGGSGLAVPLELHAARSGADESMAEERRSMYVAVTRAKRELVLTYSDKHGNGAHRKPSRFLGEMFEQATAETVDHQDQVNLELFAPRVTAQTAAVPDTILRDGLYTLSASQIECWDNCPRDFYYKHILSIPEPEGPAATYGTAIHAAIEHISKGRRSGKVPSLEEIVDLVKRALPQAGYTSVRTRERAHAQALQSVHNLYERFTTEALPFEVEQWFDVRVPDLPVRIKGRMDAVYPHTGGGVEIRDYKTSSGVRTPEQAKRRATSSLQLTVYALAWQLQHDELPASLALDFVETGQIGPVRRTQKALDTLHTKLERMVDNMQTSVYPLGKKHDYCVHPVYDA